MEKVTEITGAQDTQRLHECPEEQEWVLGGTKADDWWTLDINHIFTKEYNKWKRAAQAEPENCKITYEDSYHMIVKVRRKALRMPTLKPRARPISDEERARLAERMRELHRQQRL